MQFPLLGTAPKGIAKKGLTLNELGSSYAGMQTHILNS